MKIAAIDVGSNSIKLVVVDAAASNSFAVLAREKETIRLGHQTLREGSLSPTAIERAADCIGRFRSIAEARGAERVFAVATASVREARNSAAFVKEIKRSAGVSVEATKRKLSVNGLVSRARKECCPPVRGPLPPCCRNSRADGSSSSADCRR